MTPYLCTEHENESMNLEFTWFIVSGLQTTKPRLGFCNIAEAHGYPSWRLEKDKPDKSFFSEVTKKWMETKQFRISEWKQILTVKWKMRWKKLLFLLHTFWLYCLLYYRRFPLLCIKRDAPCQLQINWHFDFLNFPTASSLLHIREILVHWPFLEISGPQKWIVGALWPSSTIFWLEHWTVCAQFTASTGYYGA